MGIGLSALLLLGTASAFAGLAPQQKTAYAAEESVALTTENAQLFLPASYEQYLSLSNPTDVAVCEKYIAVADGSTIYVCERETQTYGSFNVGGSVTVDKIQFSDENDLYYSDSGLTFHKLVLSDLEDIQESRLYALSSFLIVGEKLYAATTVGSSSELRELALDGSSIVENVDKFGEIPYNITLCMTYNDGVLYCAANSTVYCYENKQFTQFYHLDKSNTISGLTSICALNGNLYFTENNTANRNGLYLSEDETSELLDGRNGFTALTAYKNRLYAVCGKSVIEYSVSGNSATPTGYEISADSSSVNRLSGAEESVRAGNLLVTADAINRRVSVYDFSTGVYSEIACSDTPSHVATDGKTIAVSCGSAIYTATYADKTFTLAETLPLSTPVKGLACIFGNVFYITANRYGMVGGTADLYYAYGTPKCMTNDLYGNIYVSYEDGSVYSFTEDAFLSQQSGSLYRTISGGHTSLRADFEGNLYYLSNGALYKNGEEFATIDGGDFVYLTDGTNATPVSFALGFEESEVYFNFGNYIVKSHSDALDVPSLDRIATDGIANQVFAVHGADGLLVNVSANEVGVVINLDELRGAEYFPYESYSRLTGESQGVLLGETASGDDTKGYYLVLLTNGWSYTATLFQKRAVNAIEEEYWREPEENERTQFYLSSGVHSYYAPCLEDALQEETLPRGTSVTVLGYLTAPEKEYALVSYADTSSAARTVKTGYVPQSFLSAVPPLSADGEEYLPIYLKASKDGVLFHAEDGEELLVTERTAAKAVKNEDGTYTVTIEKDGKVYVAEGVEESQIDWKDSDALRIALIIILSTLALVIIGAYIFLLPRKSSDEKPKKKKAEKTPAQKE